jgi:formate dehydrogenase beta subunit
MSKHWNVQLPDEGYWRSQIKCQAACPVHTDARGYVRAIAEGNEELGYLIARGPNPLASICGRVCGAPCESACRRGEYDEPVSIRRLKNYVCEQFGPESGEKGGGNLIEFLKEVAKKWGPRECQDQEELLPLLQSLTLKEVKPVQGKRIGIIGSGPAGLAAAHDLALLGFEVTIYEMESALAGMLMYGIPEYRLPRRVIQAEIDVILALGVKAVTNCCVGRDISFPELRNRHDAVVIAAGAKRSRKLPIPGADAEGVLGGVEFLHDVAAGKPPRLGGKVVVIGGGNVAYDVGRTVLRQISMDAARTAKRSAGVGEVYLCSLESLEEMPADDVEIIEGDEEGIIRRNSLGPAEIVKDENGRVRAVRFKRCLRVFDENKKFSPMFDEKDITEIACDTVLIAIGQMFDLSFLDAERDGIELKPNGAIACDPVHGTTSAPDVYVAGDLAYGTKLLIHAVASGKAVARKIYEQFSGKSIFLHAG